MTNKKFFEETIANEIPIFERVFKSIPDKPKDWRAHPKNQNTEEIARTLVFDSMSIPILLQTGEFDFGEGMMKDSGTILEHFF